MPRKTQNRPLRTRPASISSEEGDGEDNSPPRVLPARPVKRPRTLKTAAKARTTRTAAKARRAAEEAEAAAAAAEDQDDDDRDAAAGEESDDESRSEEAPVTVVEDGREDVEAIVDEEGGGDMDVDDNEVAAEEPDSEAPVISDEDEEEEEEEEVELLEERVEVGTAADDAPQSGHRDDGPRDDSHVDEDTRDQAQDSPQEPGASPSDAQAEECEQVPVQPVSDDASEEPSNAVEAEEGEEDVVMRDAAESGEDAAAASPAAWEECDLPALDAPEASEEVEVEVEVDPFSILGPDDPLRQLDDGRKLPIVQAKSREPPKVIASRGTLKEGCKRPRLPSNTSDTMMGGTLTSWSPRWRQS